VPIIINIAKVVAGVLTLAFQGFMIVVNDLYIKYFKPFVNFAMWALNGIWNLIKSVTIESDNWRSGVAAIQNAFKTMYNAVKPWLDSLGILTGEMGKNIGNIINSLPGMSGDATQAGGGGTGAAGLAATAINFVKSGQADKFAFSMSKNNGFLTKQLFQMGVACAQTVDQLLRMSGASKEVQDAMTASAPGSYSNLKNRGLAKSVSEKDLMPGDLVFYNPGGKGIQHVGVYVGNGQIVDASNSAGKQIGTGQRVIQRKNWMQGQAQYLRINSNQFSGQAATGPVTVNVNVGGSNASPKQIGNAAQNGTSKALTKAKQQQRKPTTVQG
jgi:hypothetical protein